MNRLLGRKAIARVSHTPGKTTMLNVYRLPMLYLVDLPGYGFARASQGERRAYHRLLQGYLRKRDTLRGIVWLLDVRHDPSAEDHEMGELLAESGRPALPVITKADKLPHGQRLARARAIAAALGVGPEPPLVTSSATGLGVADLGASILAAVRGPKESS